MSDLSTQWNAMRQLVLARDGFRCVSCGTAVRSKNADVHHLLPRSRGGSDDPSNLVTLCDGCHASFHPKLAGGLARRWFEGAALALARLLDSQRVVTAATGNLGPAIRLFGLGAFRPGQLPIILAALAGHSVLVVSPTGSGKTLCFQMPAVLSKGMSIVVSPLKALMTEQVSSLLRKRIPATYINSDLSLEEKRTRFSLVTAGAIKLLYLAPERFFVRDERERKALKQSKPAYLIVDEAHCVDQWGRDFRREYARLDEVRQKLGSPPVLAFTATAGIDMQKRILKSLGIPGAVVFVRDVDRPNIALLRWQCPEVRRAIEIVSLLKLPALKGQRAMVFVPTTKVGEKLQADLAELGLQIPFYHSRLGTAWDREQLFKRFSGESRPVVDQIICTNAFGMGLDLPNVRLVIHWQQSASVEDLFQELGRAGRDRKPSMSVIFHDPDSKDVGRLKFMAEQTVQTLAPTGQHAELMKHRNTEIERVASMLSSQSCMRQSLSKHFGSNTISRRRRLSETILNWAFGSRERPLRQGSCCDYCDAAFIRKHGKISYVRRQLV